MYYKNGQVISTIDMPTTANASFEIKENNVITMKSTSASSDVSSHYTLNGTEMTVEGMSSTQTVFKWISSSQFSYGGPANTTLQDGQVADYMEYVMI